MVQQRCLSGPQLASLSVQTVVGLAFLGKCCQFEQGQPEQLLCHASETLRLRAHFGVCMVLETGSSARTARLKKAFVEAKSTRLTLLVAAVRGADEAQTNLV